MTAKYTNNRHIDIEKIFSKTSVRKTTYTTSDMIVSTINRTTIFLFLFISQGHPLTSGIRIEIGLYAGAAELLLVHEVNLDAYHES